MEDEVGYPMTGNPKALEPHQLLDMYRQMVMIRRFDQRAVDEFHAGYIPGGVHTYIGQEAVTVGVCAALRPDDNKSPTPIAVTAIPSARAQTSSG